MSKLYRVEAVVWIEAESEKEAADEAFDEITAHLVGPGKPLLGVAVESDGELVEEMP